MLHNILPNLTLPNHVAHALSVQFQLVYITKYVSRHTQFNYFEKKKKRNLNEKYYKLKAEIACSG